MAIGGRVGRWVGQRSKGAKKSIDASPLFKSETYSNIGRSAVKGAAMGATYPVRATAEALAPEINIPVPEEPTPMPLPDEALSLTARRRARARTRGGRSASILSESGESLG